MAVPAADHPGGMMIHIFYFSHRMRYEGMPMLGTRIITSTAASNSENSYLRMRVNDIPGMRATAVFGPNHAGRYVGEVGEVYPPQARLGMLPNDPAQYFSAVLPGVRVYRAFAGYSLRQVDVSGEFHAMICF